MIKGKAKCGLCTSLGRPCNITGVLLNSRPFSLPLFLLFLLAYFFLVSRIIKESQEIDRKEAAKEELFLNRYKNLKRAQRKLNKSLSRLKTYYKRRRLLVLWGIKMTYRGLDSLEELEHAEEEAIIIEDINSLIYFNIIN